MKRTYALIVLDGWGIGAADQSNPVYAADPKIFKWLEDNYPVTSLQASGISVGLPWGEVGNSEVGHLTIGAGKVVYQYFPLIMMAIQDESFFTNPVLKKAFGHARANSGAVNFIGLLTNANVHASVEHLKALIEMGEREKVKIRLHLIADGKDMPPLTLSSMLGKIKTDDLATLTGRYYAMDRSQSWQLTEKAYECMTGDGGRVVDDIMPTVQELQGKHQSEEYLPPHRIKGDSSINDGDAVVFFNYREDSIRQLSEAFTLPGFDKFPVKPFKNLYVATFSKYEETSPAPVVFQPDVVREPLGRVLSDLGKTQLRLAEGYKYAHVTYFFNGLQETPYPNEYRAIIPSLKQVHPDDHPELMASAVTDRLLEALQNNGFDFVLANYSNPDAIGHTGNYEACVEAVRTIDKEITRVVEAVINADALLIITADHGNVEQVLNPVTGTVETQHDPNPVPFYLIGSEFKNRKFANQNNLKTETAGILADVAPTLLEIMGIPQPKEMTGQSLLKHLA